MNLILKSSKFDKYRLGIDRVISGKKKYQLERAIVPSVPKENNSCWVWSPGRMLHQFSVRFRLRR